MCQKISKKEKNKMEIKERIVTNPNRRRIVKTNDPSNTSDNFVADVTVTDEGTVTQAGTSITAELLNGKVDKTNTIAINGNTQQLGNNPSFNIGKSMTQLNSTIATANGVSTISVSNMSNYTWLVFVVLNADNGGCKGIAHVPTEIFSTHSKSQTDGAMFINVGKAGDAYDRYRYFWYTSNTSIGTEGNRTSKVWIYGVN